MTLPRRPDMSVKQWKTEGGKPIFRVAGKGKLVPTVPHGELHFQSEYGVKKGSKTPTSADDT